MASAVSPPFPTSTSPASTRTSGRRRAWRHRGADLLIALPLAALAVWAQHRGFSDPGLRLLEQRASLARTGGADLSGLRYGYPPLPTLVAVVSGGSTLSLSIATCVCTGIMLGYVARRLLQRVSAVTTVALLLPICAVPVMWYAGSQLFAPVASLAFLAVALDGFVRFTAHGETEGGFVAGLALAMCLCCDPGALVYGLVMCAFAPLIRHSRYRGEHSVMAIDTVLLFPIAAVAVGWLFLEWKFAGTFPGSLDYEAGARLLAFPSGVADTMAAAIRSAGTSLIHVPLYAAAAVIFYLLRPAAMAGLLLPVCAVIVVLWLGFVYGPPVAYLLFTILALITISETASRRFEPALAAVALGQLALVLAWPPASPYFSEWFRLVI